MDCRFGTGEARHICVTFQAGGSTGVGLKINWTRPMFSCKHLVGPLCFQFRQRSYRNFAELNFALMSGKNVVR
jgi:hypothetical protein